jgi:hypothetical protein
MAERVVAFGHVRLSAAQLPLREADKRRCLGARPPEVLFAPPHR